MNPIQLDALQELASIGSGHGLSALSKLLRLRIDVDSPETWKENEPAAIASFVAAIGAEVAAVALDLEGPLGGQLLLAFALGDAKVLAAWLGHPVSDSNFSELSQSSLLEAGNIVGSAFVSAVANLLKVKLLLSVPRLFIGTGGRNIEQLLSPGPFALLSPIAVPRSTPARLALVTRFVVGLTPSTIEGLLLMLPDERSVEQMLDLLVG